MTDRALVVPANARTIAPNRVKLSPADLRKWMETRTKLLYDAPMFSHIFYTLMSADDQHAYFTDDKQMPCAATDDTTVFIRPDLFFSRPIGDRVFILAHEICHAMFGHAGLLQQLTATGHLKFSDGTTLPFENDTWQRSGDLFINDMLQASKIGTVPSDATLDPKYTTKMSVADIYRGVYVQAKKDEQKQGSNAPGPGAGGFDTLLSPGTGKGQTPTEAAQDRDDDQWRTEIEAGMAAAKLRGQLPGAMQAMLGEVLAEPTVTWQEEIIGLFARKIGTGGYDWRTADRRMISRTIDPIYAPGRIGFGCKRIVVIGDSSGSITTKTASHFFENMAEILEELNPEEILFTWCDTKTRGWNTIEDAEDLARVKAEGAKGRGGTDFRQPFAEIEEMGVPIDAAVYLTDGDGRFPKDEPSFAVIWGDISGKPERYPWGSVVQIPEQR